MAYQYMAVVIEGGLQEVADFMNRPSIQELGWKAVSCDCGFPEDSVTVLLCRSITKPAVKSKKGCRACHCSGGKKSAPCNVCHGSGFVEVEDAEK